MFPPHANPAIAGDATAPAGLKLDLSQLFAGVSAEELAAIERRQALGGRKGHNSPAMHAATTSWTGWSTRWMGWSCSCQALEFTRPQGRRCQVKRRVCCWPAAWIAGGSRTSLSPESVKRRAGRRLPSWE